MVMGGAGEKQHYNNQVVGMMNYEQEGAVKDEFYNNTTNNSASANNSNNSEDDNMNYCSHPHVDDQNSNYYNNINNGDVGQYHLLEQQRHYSPMQTTAEVSAATTTMSVAASTPTMAMASTPALTAMLSALSSPSPMERPSSLLYSTTPSSSFIPTTSSTPSRSVVEASHVEDVLTISLELERARSQLVMAQQQLSIMTIQTNELRSMNTDLDYQLTSLRSRAEAEHDRHSKEIDTLQQQLSLEKIKSTAAEEDATLALELAKESQTSRVECELWLSRSLEEIDLWKGRYIELMNNSNRIGIGIDGLNSELVDENEPKKSVRFATTTMTQHTMDEDHVYYGCSPPSPVRSVLSTDDDDPSYHRATMMMSTTMPPLMPPTPSSGRRLPPPPPPPRIITEVLTSVSTPTHHHQQQQQHDGSINPMTLFTPNSASSPTLTNSSVTTPQLTKSTAIASGRAVLHRAITSPSPYKDVGLSPHPMKQAHDLLKKSAETRRLLRERLAPGRQQRSSNSNIVSLVANNYNTTRKNDNSDGGSSSNDGFVSRQGVACRAIGRVIRESGIKLKLKGTWWSSSLSSYRNKVNDTNTTVEEEVSNTIKATSGALLDGEEGYSTVLQLESIVKDYCGSVERTIVKQQTKIDELLAFCDHLERDVAVLQC